MSRRFTTLAACMAFAWLGSGTLAQAQSYPNQPIRIYNPYAPGGGVDVTTRALAAKLTESGWPQIVIDNRPSGGGTLAGQLTKQAKPDGYTLMQADFTTHAISATMVPDLPFDPVKDFTPITLMWTFPSILVIPASLPVKSVAELIAYAKQKPGGLNYASQGPGSGGHILGAMLAKATGVPMTHIPYKGPAPAMLDLAAGRVDLIYTSYASLRAALEAGQVRMLAISSKERLSQLPDLPTMTETGYPDVYLDAWFGLVGPAGMPADIVKTINAKVRETLQAPDMSKRITDQAWRLTTSTPEEFGALIRDDVTRLGRILKESGAAKSAN